MWVIEVSVELQTLRAVQARSHRKVLVCHCPPPLLKTIFKHFFSLTFYLALSRRFKDGKQIRKETLLVPRRGKVTRNSDVMNRALYSFPNHDGNVLTSKVALLFKQVQIKQLI